MRQVTCLAALALLLAAQPAVASDKSKNDALTVSFEIVHFFWACQTHLAPQSLPDAEAQVPSILKLGGFADDEAAEYAPEIIAKAEAIEVSDQYLNATGCINGNSGDKKDRANWLAGIAA